MDTRKLVLILGIIASVVLVFQSFTLSYRNVLLSTVSGGKFPIIMQGRFMGGDSSPNFVGISSFPLLTESVNSAESSVIFEVMKNTEASNVEEEEDEHTKKIKVNEIGPKNDLVLEDGDSDNEFDPDKDRDPDIELPSGNDGDVGRKVTLEKIRELHNGTKIEKANSENFSLLANVTKPVGTFAFNGVRKRETDVAFEEVRSVPNKNLTSPIALSIIPSVINVTLQENLDSNSSDLVISIASNTSSKGKQETKMLAKDEHKGLAQVISAVSNDNLTMIEIPSAEDNKGGSRPKSIPEMNRILLRSHLSSSMKPLWSSAPDRELLSAKTQIENAPIVKDDPDLHAPLFRNVSRFKRSYELMERVLKVYVYKEGDKPVFHTPLLKGIYASEGWFMKLMQRHKHYVVKDPRKAHLFYLPFSTRLLEFVFHKRGLNKVDMAEYIKKYANTIVSKHPFWNRTGGADHFLVACHDWAPYETKPHLLGAIRALCNADLSEGFNLGKDVSLPETYVRSAGDPLRDLGGNPASQRSILAFFAGNMHGWVRPILLQYWENRDPDMKILGPMPRGVKSKMTYIHHMKNSKYCICPRGFEVNSPRVVESIFYECVPVIISDNFVPPFFEVLDWEAFAIFVEEKDIPNLKDILLSIPDEKYLLMQQRVKKLQRHFLWHSDPVKYDIFHMTLHSIWFNRLNMLRV